MKRIHQSQSHQFFFLSDITMNEMQIAELQEQLEAETYFSVSIHWFISVHLFIIIHLPKIIGINL